MCKKLMDTHAIQLLLHYQASKLEDAQGRFDNFLKEVRAIADKHGIIFDESESFTLPGSEYRIAPCQSCGELTINAQDINENIKGMVPYFWENIKSGFVSETEAMCHACKNNT